MAGSHSYPSASSPNRHAPLRASRVANLGGSALLAVAGTAQGLDIADTPLFLGTPVDPNIMFVLDDSGSMQWEHMPDQTMYYAVYTFPMPDSVYDDTNYANQVPDHQDDNLHNYYHRSSHNNAVFYDPDQTYQPWVGAHSSPMADADPACALYNPRLPDRGCLDLTAEQTEDATWYANTAGDGDHLGLTSVTGTHSYWPISYFVHEGGPVTERESYRRVLIDDDIPATATFTSPRGITRTRDEEIQNFANWFQYHRSRILTARAGIGRAFAMQSEAMRVGFGTINKGSTAVDGEATSTIASGVRPFAGTGREDFFDELYDWPVATAGTPLRRALNDAGQYFERSASTGPWSSTPGAAGGEDLECRQSYTILMTDGFWNGPSPDLGNVDNQTGPAITGPDGQSDQYVPGPPFADEHADTLADVAMHYWKRDLRPDLENRVPAHSVNPAFWQHMVTFGVGLGVEGEISADDAFAAVFSEEDIDWPDPETSDAAKIDDLLHAGVNARGGFFSAMDPDVFAEQLGEVLGTIADRSGASATSVAVGSTRFQPGEINLAFQARFNSGDWSGDLRAFEFSATSPSFQQVWSAAEELPPAAARNIFTYSGGGTPFDGTAIADAVGGEEVLDYLRGDPANELRNGGPFRNRTTPLGDIVNSNPTVQGRHIDFGYGDRDGYDTFLEANQNRPEVVYVGSNAGMLHAFDANTGAELFAYVPGVFLDELAQLASPDYTHRFFVDGQQAIGHVQLGGQWRTVLVGGLGAGGRAMYALDITDPGSFGADNILWEISGEDLPSLGYTFGQATIGETANGQWSVLFGNGYGSDTGDAALLVAEIAAGGVTVVGTGAAPDNGLSAPVFRASPDRSIRDAFAGDLQGNLWKLDLSAPAAGQWGPAYGGPLFRATGPDGLAQAITGQPAVGSHPGGGSIVLFGTGKFFETQDNQVGDNPVIQSVYGILDRLDTGDATPLARGDLLVQSFIGQGTIAGNVVRATSDLELGDNDHGWLLDLDYPTPVGERVVTRPRILDGRVEFVTLTPLGDACEGGGTSSLFALDAASGGRPASPAFDLLGDGEFDEGEMLVIGGEPVPVSGFDPGLGIIGEPAVVENPEDGTVTRIIDGTEDLPGEAPPGDGDAGGDDDGADDSDTDGGNEGDAGDPERIDGPLSGRDRPRSWLQLR